MADVRVIENMVITDPTTPTQQAAVDASGHLQVDIAAGSATVTVETELPAAAALTDDFANPTAPGVGAFAMVWDGATWDRAPGTAADGVLVNLGTNNDVSVTGQVQVGDGTDAIDVLTDGADNVANTTNQLGTAAFLYGFDGTAWDRVYTLADGDAVAAGTKGFLILGTDGANYQALATDASGNLQVDVLTGGGSDTPTSPVSNYDTSSAIAAGSTDNHDTADLGGTTKKCSQITFGGSVALKAELQEVENGSVISTLAVGFSPAGQTVALSPPHRDYWSVAFTANAGFDGFRLARTNLDASEAADVYSVIQYED